MMKRNKLKEKIKAKSTQSVSYIRTNWKELLFVGGLLTLTALLSSEENEDYGDFYDEGTNDMDFSNRWFKNATDDELNSEREKVRERYVDSTIDIDEADKLYDVLHKFDDEMIERANSKYEKEHPNAKPRHREHGWYLSNDD